MCELIITQQWFNEYATPRFHLTATPGFHMNATPRFHMNTTPRFHRPPPVEGVILHTITPSLEGESKGVELSAPPGFT